MGKEQTAARERCWWEYVGVSERRSKSSWNRKVTCTSHTEVTRAARESASQFQKTKHFIRLVFILVRTRDHVILMQHLIYYTLIFCQ